jgi:hypothetical protein
MFSTDWPNSRSGDKLKTAATSIEAGVGLTLARSSAAGSLFFRLMHEVPVRLPVRTRSSTPRRLSIGDGKVWYSGCLGLSIRLNGPPDLTQASRLGWQASIGR